MKRWGVLAAAGIVTGVGIGLGLWVGNNPKPFISPEGKVWERFGWVPKPSETRSEELTLGKYTIESLGRLAVSESRIVLDDILETNPKYIVYKFHFGSQGKKVNGLAHIPNGDSVYPIIVQFRGWQDPATYQTGGGTKRSAVVYAENGFISLAPDFLGYGGSDNPSNDVFEARFETYTTAMDMLAAARTVPQGDPNRIGIWGHSNGGQIALTALEITRKLYPTTLWAPVSKPFPYSILYYTDDTPDHGKELRKRLYEFEKNYDVELYSLPNYLDRIKAPVQLHQGTADALVPVAWSLELNRKMKEKKIDVTYWEYAGADHNMIPEAWNIVVERDMEFFRKNLK